MGYSICGLIIRQPEEQVCAKHKLPFVKLAQGVSLIPLDRDYILLTDGDDTQPTEIPDFSLPPWLSEIASHFSKSAYIEAAFWGGTGMQASMVMEKGSIIFCPEIWSHAINSALRQMGVNHDSPSPSLFGHSFTPGSTGDDPFDMVDLGRHRSVAGWLEESAKQAAVVKGKLPGN